ncbi:MAG: hypothetical protein LKG79_05240 [Furfurilactobacillus sp.]|nr:MULTISPECIES: hypothetical protein [Furfurilactobacillus]MCF6161704.1 hypothetical protein [Furfurilactobacillus milii]MCF6164073.1 hypothetical protein [Furfurilactobacillus milii]MCF6166350.1 hypothetical protein [Furfurilactobacillus rossiae]MCF6419485.1 hypothetical protein [Furfurilactobacillus milii]MCH4011619.1 hypothetical protein [Furfurilactobacillus sp.]
MMADENGQYNDANIEYDDADVKKALDIIADKGFISVKDFPKLDDRDWAHGFSTKIIAASEDRNSDPYIYFEQFDYDDSSIHSAIWDMDQIKTREDALLVLGKELGVNELKPNGGLVEDETY